MKYYISGRMSGLKDLGYGKFEEAELLLTADGFDVINPCKLHKDIFEQKPWSYFMATDLYELLKNADAIYMLDDWWLSKGATLELISAILANKRVSVQSASVAIAGLDMSDGERYLSPDSTAKLYFFAVNALKGFVWMP